VRHPTVSLPSFASLPRFVALPLVVALAVAPSACGGGKSRADFVRDTSRICRETNDRFARVKVERPSEAHARAALSEIVGIGAEALRELRRVKPPRSAQADVDSWLGLLEQALDEVDYARALLRGGDVTRAVSAIARADVLATRAERIAGDIGIGRACRVPKLLPGA
jgi:hypothetical protein